MKLLLCAIAALTLSVSSMNAQEKADVVTANKTQVDKKANKTQSIKSTSKTQKVDIKREDAKGTKGKYEAPKNKQAKKATKKTDAQLKEEKKAKQKAKQKAKSIDN